MAPQLTGRKHHARPSVALFDLDDTLYQIPEIREHVVINIRRFIVERLGWTPERAEEECPKYYVKFGTTLAGLAASGIEIDYDQWHREVHHSIDYASFIKSDPELRRMLQQLELPKWVFTNADRKHAEICLDLLGVADLFEGQIDFESTQEDARRLGLGPYAEDARAAAGAPSPEGASPRAVPHVVCKPNRAAFEVALAAVGTASAPDGFSSCLWFDDSTRNVAAGHNLGMISFLVGRTDAECSADYQIQSVLDLPKIMPELFASSKVARPRLRVGGAKDVAERGEELSRAENVEDDKEGDGRAADAIKARLELEAEAEPELTADSERSGNNELTVGAS